MSNLNPLRCSVLLILIAVVCGSSSVSTLQRASPGALGANGLAAQPGPAYASTLGPASIDDGLSRLQDTGQAVTKGLTAAADVFGSADARPDPSASPAVRAARDLDARIPASEYDLGELAKTLPDDPDTLYRFVTDRIAVDGYDGVMRGPLGTWMSRAGSPTDKAVLLAWLFVTKHIPYQFARGALSAAERARVATAAAAPAPIRPVDPKVASYLSGLNKDGDAFAAWARGLLSTGHIPTGDGKAPADRLSPRHYWIQIARGNSTVDLDPTLPGTAIGTHLGATDASFTPTAVLPRDEWHQLQIRLTASFANNTTSTLLDHTDTVPNLAYSPVRLLIAPANSADPLNPGTATAFDVGLQIGSAPAGHSRVDLGSGTSALQSVVLEVRRTAPGSGVIVVAHRSFIDTQTAAADRAYRLAGMTTMVVVPGLGATAFATHMQFHALQQLAEAAAEAKSGAATPPQPWYPIRLIDYYRRDDAMAEALGAASGARLFRDRPNVAMLRTAFMRSGSTTTVVTAFDIADNGMASLAAQNDVVLKENMIRGYADTRIERDVVEGPSSAGTIALFAAAATQNVAASVLTRKPSTSDALHDGMDQTFAAGQVAIAPSAIVNIGPRPVYGWWAIDPTTGNSVGRMTGGGGQDLAEESVLISRMSSLYTMYGQAMTGKECMKDGFGSPGCAAAVCASLASYVFGGGTLTALASNVVGGAMTSAGCSSVFGAGSGTSPTPETQAGRSAGSTYADIEHTSVLRHGVPPRLGRQTSAERDGDETRPNRRQR